MPIAKETWPVLLLLVVVFADNALSIIFTAFYLCGGKRLWIWITLLPTR